MVFAEKENYSKEIIKRLLHEVMNPLSVASGLYEIEFEKNSKNKHLI